MASDGVYSTFPKGRESLEVVPVECQGSSSCTTMPMALLPSCIDNFHEEKTFEKHELNSGRGSQSNSILGETMASLQDSKSSADCSSLVHCNNGNCGKSIKGQFSRRSNGQRGCTLQDFYENKVYDDEDDEDSDWEPEHHLILRKWFCANCTMPNFDDVSCCDVCGEGKDSEMFQNGAFQNHLQESQVSVDAVSVSNHPLTSSLKKSSTVFGYDKRMLLHCEVELKSHPHPERPDRLRAIFFSLVAAGIYPKRCVPVAAREITNEELQMVHSLDHIDAVQQTSSMLYSYFTSDTYANEHSACAARLAAGVCADLASLIVSGRARNGFALVRPPGHHAGIKQAMGFCLHNNAAVAAFAAQRAGARTVLIVDWDVHHGNGTQEIFNSNKSVLYVSLHRHEGGRFYPGTGAIDEVGTMDGEGFSVNIPWSCGGVGDHDYLFAFQHIVLPIAVEFAPDITIISAGFDAARGDPLGCCDVTPDGFAQMTYMLNSISNGKLLVILEGGYNLRSISSSATAVIKVLLGDEPGYDMRHVAPSKEGLQTILQVAKVQLKFWPVLKDIYTSLKSEWQSFISSGRGQDSKKRKRVALLPAFKLSRLFFYGFLGHGRLGLRVGLK